MRPRLSLLAVLASLAAASSLCAQAPAPAPAPKGSDTPVQLSPFEVNTSKDTSYGALNSTSITAFNMQLLKTPVAADIFTEEFMRDVAATTVEDLLNGYGAGVGQVFPTPDSNSNDNQPGDRVGIGPIGSRGVAGSFTRRNGFVASASSANYTDMFDMERVEMIKGANALLYGSSGAGGDDRRFYNPFLDRLSEWIVHDHPEKKNAVLRCRSKAQAPARRVHLRERPIRSCTGFGRTRAPIRRAHACNLTLGPVELATQLEATTCFPCH